MGKNCENIKGDYVRGFLLFKRFAITSKNENNKEMMDIKERKSLARKYATSTKAAPAKGKNCEKSRQETYMLNFLLFNFLQLQAELRIIRRKWM